MQIIRNLKVIQDAIHVYEIFLNKNLLGGM